MNKHNLKSGLLFATVILFVALAGTSHAGATAGTELQITNDTNHQRFPAIYGDKVAWSDYTGGDIYLYNISTEEQRRLTTSGYTKNYLHMRGDIITWNDPSGGLYLYDLKKGEERSFVSSSLHNAEYPNIYDNKIVFSAIGPEGGNPDIFVYDITTDITTQITTDTAPERKPAIYGNKVVFVSEPEWWDDWQKRGVYVYDLETQELTKIYSGPVSSSAPLEIYGNAVVWREIVNPAGSGYLHIYDLETKTDTLFDTRSAINYLRIFRDKIVWVGTDLVSYKNAIYLYDITTGEQSRISSDMAEPDLFGSPDIHEGGVVWADMRSGNLDIYLYQFASQNHPPTPSFPLPSEVTNAEGQYLAAVQSALNETTLTYSEMVADTAVDTAYILIDNYLEEAIGKLLKVDATTPLREQIKKESMKAFAELATNKLEKLAPDPTAITTLIVAKVIDEVFLVDQTSDIVPRPTFSEITNAAHLDFIGSRLTSNPSEETINFSIARVDALRALAGHTADDIKVFKMGTFDPIEKIQEAGEKAKFYIKLGGAALLGKAIIVPVSAPVNYPVGVTMLVGVSAGLKTVGLLSEVGEWFMLMHIFGDVYLAESQTVRLFTTGLEGTISNLNSGEFPQVRGEIVAPLIPEIVELNGIGKFGGTFKNSGDMTIDARLLISITDPYGEVRKYTTETTRVAPQEEKGLSADIPFHGTPLIIGGGTGEHTAEITAEYGILALEQRSEDYSKTFNVAYEPSPFVKTIIDNLKPFGELIINIQVTNNSDKPKTYTIVDEIPKELASDLTTIKFSRQPDRVLNPDPVVAWDIVLGAGESATLEYKITNLSRGFGNEFLYPQATLIENGTSKDSVQLVLDKKSAYDLGEDSLRMLLTQASSLPDSAFGEKPEQKRKALVAKVKEIIEKVASSDFIDATNKLTNDIRPKVDSKPNPQDWVVEEVAQKQLLRLVDDAVALISLLP